MSRSTTAAHQIPNIVPTRLIVKTSLSSEQAGIAKHLIDASGICTCGQLLGKADSKFLFAQVNSQYVSVPEARNMLLVSAYCAMCFNRINAFMRTLRNAAVERKYVES